MRFLLNDALIDTEHLDGIVHLLTHGDQIGIIKKKGDTLCLYVCKQFPDPQWANPWWSDYAQCIVENETDAKALFLEYAREA